MVRWLLVAMFIGSALVVIGASSSAGVSANAQATPETGPLAPATPCVPASGVGATPIATDGEFPMPTCGTVVIDATVNAGPLPPEYQEGYEITIDTSGVAIVAINWEGTPTPEVTIVNLGEDGLQELLQQLQEIGFFDLLSEGTPGPESDMPVGGPTNNLSVWLGDQTWQVSEYWLSSEGQEILNESQQAIVDAVGVAVP
jgi:hypothetical protein